MDPRGQQSELKYSENIVQQFLDTHFDRKLYVHKLRKKKRFNIVCERQTGSFFFFKCFTIFRHQSHF